MLFVRALCLAPALLVWTIAAISVPQNNVFLVIRRKFTLDLIILAFPTKVPNLSRINFEKWQVTIAVFQKISETQVNDRLEKHSVGY